MPTTRLLPDRIEIEHPDGLIAVERSGALWTVTLPDGWRFASPDLVTVLDEVRDQCGALTPEYPC